jgi:hypothetical protein
LVVDGFVATIIAIIAYRQNKQNQKISQFFDNQVQFVREDIGRCLTNIFSALYSTSNTIEDLQHKIIPKGILSSNIQTIEFHYSNNTMYLEPYKAHSLTYLISQIKQVNDGKFGIPALLNNVVLALERSFPNRYTQEIDYLLQDFVIKYNAKYPQSAVLQNLSLFNPNAKKPYDEFIVEKIYDIKAMANWVLTHLDHPELESVNSFIRRTESQLESLHHIKNNNTVKDLETYEIDFLIEFYESAKRIFEINHITALKYSELKRFTDNLTKATERYGEYLE